MKSLHDFAIRFRAWLFDSALPLWWERGADRDEGGFHELLGLDGVHLPGTPRRARVQSRQSYTYALAGRMGWQGPWRQAAPHGIDYLILRYLSANGQFCTLVSSRGEVLDASTLLYDQAFALLAMAGVVQAMPERTDLRETAHVLLARVKEARTHSAGGFTETSGCRFLTNPHMHLFEAALAWCEIEPGTLWDALADGIAELCLAKFIDRKGGFLREYFDDTWQPVPGDLGHVVEPGHQFEWCWLLERWARMRNDSRAHHAAVRLYDAGVRGVDPRRDAAVEALSDDFTVTRPRARLWSQTERIKAALILSEAGDGRDRLLEDAAKGAASLWRYLETPVTGLWRDKLEADDTFVEEPAPASSFYHIACCIASLQAALQTK